jgi:hypothetical protein
LEKPSSHRTPPHFHQPWFDGIARYTDPKVGVICYFLGPSFCSFRKAAFSQGLNTPGDPLEKKILVMRPRFLTEDIDIPFPQFADSHPGKGLHLLVSRFIHWNLHTS